MCMGGKRAPSPAPIPPPLPPPMPVPEAPVIADGAMQAIKNKKVGLSSLRIDKTIPDNFGPVGLSIPIG